MKRLLFVLETECLPCQRAVKTASVLPMGKSALYGCRECHAFFVRVEFTLEESIQILSDRNGIIKNMKIVDFL